MDASALAQRVARVRRAVERAASETPSEARQTALETLSHFARDLAEHFAAEDASLPPGSPRRAQHARLRGDLREIDERARTAGDWPESWRSVAAAFDRFGVALEQYERTETT
jgi:hypothetical protein